MEHPVSQIERERVYSFIETVQAIRAGHEQGLTLSEYWPREIADAIQLLINSAVRREREECALVAESAAEPAGTVGRGDTFDADPARRRMCLEVAASIRERQ
jgi:hypothetical protein